LKYELSYQLKTELWNTFSDGGELQWIHDINILHVMAQTYDSLRMVLHAENTYTTFELNASIQHGVPGDWPNYAKLHRERLFDKMHETINSALKNIEGTLRMIEEKILKNVAQITVEQQ
jgi:hypothetical protein